MTLRAEEFVRRFFLHVLPPGFVRIRHFGIFSNRLRKLALEVCRNLLAENGVAAVAPPSEPVTTTFWVCPDCGGVMVLVERLTPAQTYVRPPPLTEVAA
jgi:hypothetical protein